MWKCGVLKRTSGTSHTAEQINLLNKKLINYQIIHNLIKMSYRLQLDNCMIWFLKNSLTSLVL